MYPRPRRGDSRLYQNKRAKIALGRSHNYQTSVLSIDFTVQERKFNTDFQDGGHLGFSVRMILATFHLQVTSIFPSFESVGVLVQNKKIKKDIQHGC